MRIVIIGAGAMGGTYGGLMAKAGVDVTLIDTWAEHVQAIRENGLVLDDVGEAVHVEVPIHERLDRPGDYDVAIVQTDTNNRDAAAQTAKAALKPDGIAITLQNGIGNVETLVAALGEERVLGGVSYHSALMLGPGRPRHSHAGKTYLGELDGRTSQRLQALVAALERGGLGPEISDNVMGICWSKFIHNCALNPLCALLELRVGEIPLHEGADLMQTKCVEEALAIAEAKGIRLATPDPLGHIKAYTFKFNKPSMLQHMEANRPTEIDALNGAVVREGRALGIPTPYNEALTWMVKARNGQLRRVAAEGSFDFGAMEAAEMAKRAT